MGVRRATFTTPGTIIIDLFGKSERKKTNTKINIIIKNNWMM